MKEQEKVEKSRMTKPKMIQILDQAIDQSMKRSTSSPKERAHRKYIRSVKAELRAGHKRMAANRRLRKTVDDLLEALAEHEEHHDGEDT